MHEPEEEYVPRLCVWELTLRCNMRCIHCGSKAGKARLKELSVEKCLAVADELAELGTQLVSLIGGEVFLYKGWDKVAQRLIENGMTVNIITNAALMGDAEVDAIKNVGLNNVGISIDGMRDNHNKIRNNKASFDLVLRAFARLRDAQVPIAAITCLLAPNLEDLEPLYDLLVENSVTVWQIQLATAMGNMAKCQNLLISPDKIPLVTRFIHEKRDEGMIRLYAGDDIGYFDEHELYLRNHPGTISSWGGCQAGLTAVGIDSAGNVKGCESLYSDEFIEGNLCQESLKDIWFKEGNFAYNRNFDKSSLGGKCATCDRAERCRGGCRGSSYFTTGSLFENAYCCYPGALRQP